jgi:hypothetical protein
MLKAAFCKDATQTGTIEANGYQISLIITTALITILLGVFPGALLARFMEAFAS